MNKNQNKIKIAHIIPMFAVGGAERIVVDLLKNFDRNKFDITLVCLRDNDERLSYWKKELEDDGIRIVTMAVDDASVFHYLLRAVQIIKLAYFLKKEKIQIVHTHLLSADIVGRFSALLANTEIIVSTEHNENRIDGALKRFLKTITNKMSTKVIGVSGAVKEAAIKYSGATDTDTVVIRNGIEVEKFLYLDRKYDNNGRIVIGAMGRLTKQKGFDLLVEAAGKMKSDNFVINIAGDRDFHEDLKGDLENRAKELGLSDNVKLVGLQKDANAFYKKLDIFVMSSRWEGLPVVLLEAGLSGLPVSVPDIGGITEVVKHQENGYVYKKEDISEMARSLDYLIENKTERERMGNNLRNDVLNNFTVKKMADEYQDLYLELIK